jgi:hypothetical protein
MWGYVAAYLAGLATIPAIVLALGALADFDSRASVGIALLGVFGDPTIVLRYASHYTAKIIKFPERRSELAKLRAEIEELQRSFRCAEAV